MKGKQPAKDIISNLPQNIIETILCHLHIRDAVRTSILSKNWRYSWTRIPKLVFVEDIFEEEYEWRQPRNLMHLESKFLYAMYQVLLMHQGPILQFTCDMRAGRNRFLIDQIILHLSRSNTVTELKLQLNGDGHPYVLPFSIYSLQKLTYLHLFDCRIRHKPTFSGFGSLTTLCLRCVSIYGETLLRLLSKSPLLKTVTLSLFCRGEHISFIELLECLPLVENLTIANEWIDMCLFVEAGPQKLPSPLVHLKYVSLDMCFVSDHGLSLLSVLIKSSPNLEKINLQSRRYYRDELCIETNPVKLEDYSDIWLEHLNELKIEYFAMLKTELEFVMLILAKSPVLKKAKIVLDTEVTKVEEMMLSRMLLKLFLVKLPVSPVVEISVERLPGDKN
uniref:F-box/FBD/LRR-repeat protein At1g13570-like n=1 Tax=Erigeron canadensis TaxID=72917 RepID=UPI001CB97699|nr:F-box/FBD/LRR-repeat protein At1g13570-like [Erigeron canadensis]XP_043634798.1 F-box/FBD/LRR-repeat protein At1g13570-like [Erigeron canadensis]